MHGWDCSERSILFTSIPANKTSVSQKAWRLDGHNQKQSLHPYGDLVSSDEARHERGMVLVNHEPSLGRKVFLLQRLKQISRHLRHFFLVSVRAPCCPTQHGGGGRMGGGGVRGCVVFLLTFGVVECGKVLLRGSKTCSLCFKAVTSDSTRYPTAVLRPSSTVLMKGWATAAKTSQNRPRYCNGINRVS